MKMDVSRMSYEELYRSLEGSTLSPQSLVRKGRNVVLELNDAPTRREPPWELGLPTVDY